jgi:hypothetical protein
MAFVLKDRVSETTTTTGTGTITLAGAETGFQAFSVIGDGNTTYYCITDGTAWEVGVGTYTLSGNTLARTTIISNSNGNTSPITLSAGVKNVFGVLPSVNNITPSGLWENSKLISTNYTITTNNNALSAGPIEVATGVNVTVPSGSVWTVI